MICATPPTKPDKIKIATISVLGDIQVSAGQLTNIPAGNVRKDRQVAVNEKKNTIAAVLSV